MQNELQSNMVFLKLKPNQMYLQNLSKCNSVIEKRIRNYIRKSKFAITLSTQSKIDAFSNISCHFGIVMPGVYISIINKFQLCTSHLLSATRIRFSKYLIPYFYVP